MRILHLIPSYLPAYRYGGPIYSVHGLCSALVKAGHEVHVFTTNVNGRSDSPVPLETEVDLDGVKVTYFSVPRFRRLYYSPRMKSACLTQLSKFDILHTHSVFLWPTNMAARLAKRLGIPYVVSPRGMMVKDLIKKNNWLLKQLWIYTFERKTLENASALHCTSKTEADDLQAFDFSLPDCFVIPNGIEIPPPEESALPRSGLLFLSRVDQKKGLDRLIPALARLPDVTLTIAGNDENCYRKEIEKLANIHQVLERIQFVGAKYDLDKSELYRRAAAFVLPSYSESFGLVVMEALAHSCPVIITPEVGVSDWVAEHGLGVVCSGEAEELATQISNLLADQTRRQAIAKLGPAKVKEDFSWATIATNTLKQYARLLMQ